jgi:hypothetical protein
LEVARSASNQADKMVALRGYFNLAKLGELSEPQRLKMCADADSVVQRPEEKRLLLAALGDMNSPEAVKAISPYLADSAIKEEAANAIVAVCERLLRKTNAAKIAPELVDALRGAAKATSNGDLSNRAGKLLEQAETKAAQK